jgi:hypothetical protein
MKVGKLQRQKEEAEAQVKSYGHRCTECLQLLSLEIE